MSSPLEEVPFTELIQQPVRTTGRLAGRRALKLRRRDAFDLVLMSAERADQEGEVVDLTARLLAAVIREKGGAEVVARVLPDVLHWVRFLPDDDKSEFAAEFVDTAEAAASINNVAPISVLLTQWRHTAEVYADPELLAILTRPLDGDFGPVPRPGDGE
ncbi:hypothetical protein [Longispora albida]|uniref:hypothetical protein n=1 Tax=Longispora albida TaxID=203523 RepID=UPI000377EA6A|nr:hypothetical protein [Longispora albida]